MANPILLPTNFSEYNFQKLAKKEPNPANRIRLIAMANIQEGKTLTSIATMLKVHWEVSATVRAWYFYKF